jgi:hypothetical protein
MPLVAHRIRLVVAVLLMALAVGAGSAHAGTDPPVDPREACRIGGWHGLSPDGVTPFASQGACISFAAQGGVPQPAPSLRMFSILQGTQCAATFFADHFPAGAYAVSLSQDGGPPQLLEELTIDETVEQVLVFIYLVAPRTVASVTVTDGDVSATLDFKLTCK